MGIEQSETRHAGGAGGLGNLSFPGGDDNRVNRPKPAAAQAEISRNPAAVEAKRTLLREWLIETLGYAQIYAANAQTFADLQDDTLALLSLGQFHKAAKAACQCGAELRGLREAERAIHAEAALP